MKKCGTCCYWMIKRVCKREDKGVMVHAGMWACDDYSEEAWYTKLCKERGKEI